MVHDETKDGSGRWFRKMVQEKTYGGSGRNIRWFRMGSGCTGSHAASPPPLFQSAPSAETGGGSGRWFKPPQKWFRKVVQKRGSGKNGRWFRKKHKVVQDGFRMHWKPRSVPPPFPLASSAVTESSSGRNEMRVRNVVQECGSRRWFKKVVQEGGSGRWFRKLVQDCSSTLTGSRAESPHLPFPLAPSGR